MRKTPLAAWIARRLDELDLKPAQLDRQTQGEITASYLSRVLKGTRPGADWLKRLAPELRADVLFLYQLAGYLDEDDAVGVAEPAPMDPLERQAVALARAAREDEREWLAAHLDETLKLMLAIRQGRPKAQARPAGA